MSETHDADAIQEELRECRAQLQQIDRHIVETLSERLRIARRTRVLKEAASMPILDPQREAAVIRAAVEHARTVDVPEEAVREIFWHIIGMSRRIQEEGGS
jgi:chorismate mutase/prephenate dehydrogenase